MTNKNMSAKERNLVKGALRRVFSRSDLRRKIIALTVVPHIDPTRPRVKKWSICQECKQHTPTYLMQVDHKDPVVPIDKALEDMTWDTVVDRLWCDENNLTPMCKACHLIKSKKETKLRKEFRHGNKTNPKKYSKSSSLRSRKRISLQKRR